MKLSIIVPTYNEQQTVEQVIQAVLAAPLPIPYELVLIDDHSEDHTLAIERRLQQLLGEDRVRVVCNSSNRGKGHCIRQGLAVATGELVIIQDGDLEYRPADIPQLLAPILAGRAAVVYGSRFLHHQWPHGMRWPNVLANRLLTWLTNRLYRLHLTDMETGYKIVPRELVMQLGLCAERFEFEPEITARLARQGVPITEVPIAYEARGVGCGKKIRPWDFFIAVQVLWSVRFAR